MLPGNKRKFFFATLGLSALFLLFLALPQFAKAGLNVTTGDLPVRTSAGSQSVTGLGFRPKALIFFYNKQTAPGSLNNAATWANLGIGIAASSTAGPVLGASESVSSLGAGTSDTASAASSTREIIMLQNATVVSAAADVTSFDVDGFTLNWLKATTTPFLLHYYAIGGSDITNAYSGRFDMNTVTGNQGVTGTGFKPDFLMFLFGTSTRMASSSVGGPTAMLGMGFAASSTAGSIEQAGLSVRSNDAAGTSITCGIQTATSAIPLIGTCDTIDALATVASFDSNGFTINKSDAPATSSMVYYLALKGGDHAIGSFNKPTAVGNSTTTAIGHTPIGLFTLSRGLTANGGATADFSFNVGAGTSSARGESVSLADLDADNSPDPDMRTTASSTATSTATLLGVSAAAGTVTGEASIWGFSDDGFSLYWSTADATARQMLFWTVAPDKIMTVSATGTQVSPLNIGQTAQYVGGAFNFITNTSSTDVTSIKVTETNTVNASTNLSNLSLYYEGDNSRTCTYNGTETLFGSAASFTSEAATVTGSMTVSSTYVCVYPVVDIGSGASGFLDFEISNPSLDVVVTRGTSTPATAAAISGSSTLQAVAGPDVSGTCKQWDESSNCVDGETVRVVVNGTLQTQTGTTAGGSWTVTGITQPSAGAIITVFITSTTASVRAGAITYYGSSGNLSGVQLFERHLVLGATSSQTFTNASTSVFDNSVANDPNVFWDVDASNNLNVDVNNLFTDERLMVRSGNTFRPDATGAVKIIRSANFYASSTATSTLNGTSLRLDGSFINFGNFVAGTSSVEFSSSTSEVYCLACQFYNLTASSTATVTASTTFAVSSTLSAVGTFNIISGATTTAPGTITLTGTIGGAGTLLITDTSGGPGASGTLNTRVRYDASTSTIAATTFVARTYGGLVEAYSNSALARTLILANGAYTFSAGLNVLSAGTATTTLDASSTMTGQTVTVTGDIDFTGTGSGNEEITGGANTWNISGNADFSNGFFRTMAGNTLQMTGTGTLTATSTNLWNLTVNSASTVTLLSGATTTVQGNFTLAGAGTPVFTNTTIALTSSTAATIDGGGKTVNNLRASSTGTFTVSNTDITVGNALEVASGGTISISSGRTITASSSLTLSGTISGMGTLLYKPSTAFPTGGTISATTTFDSAGNNQIISARTFGGNVKIDNSGSTTGRTVTLGTAGGQTITFSGGLDVAESGTGDVNLTGSANAPAVSITGDLTCSAGTGNGITTGNSNWTASGNINFTNCTLSAGATSTFTMSGTGTLTSNGQTLKHLTLSGTVTLANETHTITGNLNMAGGTISAGNSTIVMTSSSASIVGGGQTLSNLNASSSGTITLNASDLTVSSTIFIATSTIFSVPVNRTVTVKNSLILDGQLTGAGRLTYQGSANFPATGTSTISFLRFDAANNNQSIAGRTYDGTVEIDNSGTTAGRTVTLGTGAAQAITINSDLVILSSGSGGVLLTGSANNPDLNIIGSSTITAGGGSKDITTGAGAWNISGNFNLTNVGVFTATAGNNLLFGGGTSRTFTPASQTFANLDFSNAVSPIFSGNATSTGDVTLISGMTLTGVTLKMAGQSKSLIGAGNTLPNLTIDGAAASTSLVTSDITISGTLEIGADDTLTIGGGRVLTAQSIIALPTGGAISGAGRLDITGGSGPGTTGTLNVPVRFDASAGNIASTVFDARTYSGLVEAYASSVSARTITMGSGSFTFSNGFNVVAGGAGDTTLDASSSDPTVASAGGFDFTGVGSGSEIVQAGTGGWTVSAGNVDLTGGSWTTERGGSLTLSGLSQTLTTNSQQFGTLSFSGATTPTISGNATSSGNVTLVSGMTLTGVSLLMTSTTATIVGGGNTLPVLIIDPISAGTITLDTSDLTISSALTIASGDTLSIAAGRNLAQNGATLTMTGGTISGAGRFIYATSTTFPTDGTISSILRFDTTNYNQAMPSRTYGGAIEVTNTGVSNRTLTIAAGTYSLAGLTLFASSSGNMTLDASTNAATGTISGSVTFAGGGSGSESITMNSAPWTISGNLDISNGSFTAPAGTLNLSGNFTNTGGTFTHNSGTVVLNGSVQQTLSGTLSGSSAFNVFQVTNNSGDATTTPSVIINTTTTAATSTFATASSSIRFLAGTTHTYTNINWAGNVTNRVFLRSSSAGASWLLNANASGAQTVTYVDVKDSDASLGNEITATDGTNNNSGGNTNWVFSVIAPSVTSTADDVFEINAASTTIANINIKSGAGSPVGKISSSSDIRIRIPDSFNAVWDNTVTSISCAAGDSCAKISTTGVTYESSNKIAVIDAIQNFSNGNWVQISGLKMGNFSAINSATTTHRLRVDGPSSNDAAADTRTKTIKGKMTHQDHAAGQMESQFDISDTSITAAALLRFRLAPVGENATMTTTTIAIVTVHGVVEGNIQNAKLYQDINGNGVVDALEPQLGANGTTTIANSSGTIVFGGSWTATTTTDIIFQADMSSVDDGDNLRLQVSSANVSAKGVVTNEVLNVSGSSASVNHGKPVRSRGGGSGASFGGGSGSQGGAFGGSVAPPPSGDGEGGSGGGGGAGGGGSGGGSGGSP